MRRKGPTTTARHIHAGSDPTPLYFRLQTLLREAIDSLEYPPGSRLPAERAMAGIYGVSRITVRQALDALARDGVIRRRRGRKGGTFVATPASVDSPPLVGRFNVVIAPKRSRRIAVDAFDERVANSDIAAALQLPSGARVRYIERRFLGATGAQAFVRNFLPAALGERLRRRVLARTTLYEILSRQLNVKIAEVRDEVSAILADTQIAPRLGVPVGRPLLSIRRLYLAPGDEPVNLTILITRSDRYKVAVRLRDHELD